jgi:hypothetical protein
MKAGLPALDVVDLTSRHVLSGADGKGRAGHEAGIF